VYCLLSKTHGYQVLHVACHQFAVTRMYKYKLGLDYKPGVWLDCTNRSRGLLFKDLWYTRSSSTIWNAFLYIQKLIGWRVREWAEIMSHSTLNSSFRGWSFQATDCTRSGNQTHNNQQNTKIYTHKKLTLKQTNWPTQTHTKPKPCPLTAHISVHMMKYNSHTQYSTEQLWDTSS